MPPVGYDGASVVVLTVVVLAPSLSCSCSVSLHSTPAPSPESQLSFELYLQSLRLCSLPLHMTSSMENLSGTWPKWDRTLAAQAPG